MKHYHGLPITPDTVAMEVARAGHLFLSHAYQQQAGLAIEFASSFALDNGAFSAWLKKQPVTDWSAFYEWADDMRRYPACEFAIIPDVIDGTEEQNDSLIMEWPLGNFGVPVWHMHESLDRLKRLASRFTCVALGSSGEYRHIGTRAWWQRMAAAMETVCDHAGRPRCKIHGLRMLDPAIFTRLPFASADSTNIARNMGIDQRWTGPYVPATKEARARVMRDRIEAFNAPPPRWDFKIPETEQQVPLW